MFSTGLFEKREVYKTIREWGGAGKEYITWLYDTVETHELATQRLPEYNILTTTSVVL
jgi:hypothetical protein